MKTQILLLLMMVFSASVLTAQQTVTVSASTYDISDNLDLESVAYLFGESKNLEEFERKLNDPELQISNLDLNRDGYVDYLRVVEVKEKNIYAITIQAVLGPDIYQDVATIDVEVKNKNKVYIQVVGNHYIYGRNYIIEPVYVRRPLIFDFFWHPRHFAWVSPYYWSSYPVYYSRRSPWAVDVYHHHVYTHYRPMVKCHYVSHRKIPKAVVLHEKVYRNDMAKSQPEQSFENRNSGMENRRALTERRTSTPNTGSTGTATRGVQQSDSKSVSTQARVSRSYTRSTPATENSRSGNKSVTVENSRRNTRQTNATAPAENRRVYNRSTSSANNRSVTPQSTPARVNTEKSSTVRDTRNRNKVSTDNNTRTRSSAATTRQARSNSNAETKSASTTPPGTSRTAPTRSEQRNTTATKPATRQSESRATSGTTRRSSNSSTEAKQSQESKRRR